MLSKLISDEKMVKHSISMHSVLKMDTVAQKIRERLKKYYQLAQSNGYEGAKRKKRFGLF